MSRTAADDLVDALVAVGVQRIYGLVGDSLNALTEALRRRGGADRGGIDWVHVHHEEAAAFAAAAEAQLTGRLAVCAGSCGPGNTHLLQGVLDAQRSGAPVLALASHIASRQIGTGFFQETRPEAVFSTGVGFCETVAHPSQTVRLTRLAVQHAIGRRGAAVLVLPGDVLTEAGTGEPVGATITAPPAVAPDPASLTELAARIADAREVAVFAGIGAAGARAEVLALAERLQAPVGHTLRGKESLQYDNPYDVGMTGLLGYGACYRALHRADLVLLLGTDFPYDDFLPTANVVQVDVAPERLGRRVPLAQGVVADVGAALRGLLPLLPARTDRRFLDDMLAATAHHVETAVEAYTSLRHQHVPIHPEYLASLVDAHAADDAVFTVDTGMCCTWAARYLTPNGRRRILGSFVHGSMADALPLAIGAQVSHPDRQVVALCGDGGLAMLLGELLTVKTHRLPLKVVVFDNSSLGMVRLEMLVAGDPPFETDHDAVDYAAVAAALGFHARRVTEPGELEPAVTEFLAHDGPALLDVVTTPDALEVPTHLTATEARGFALALGRTVLEGGVGRVVELARQNLRNTPH
ncbi:pyruvate dehydrogenase [Actinomycetospora chlora]|uniref:Pyruvate dehydrogenase n=1 Tax=Actinomycetospora chlora TaxID=663608 RepID=A0ABP9C3Q2_9PSEU